MVATIARLVREIRCDARPGEQEQSRAVAKRVAQTEYKQRPKFAYADLQAADGWGDLPKAASLSLLRFANLETTAANGPADATAAANRGISGIIALTSQKLV